MNIIQPRAGHHLVAAVKVDGQNYWESRDMLDLVLEERDDKTDKVTHAWLITSVSYN